LEGARWAEKQEMTRMKIAVQGAVRRTRTREARTR
jgi:hypothetical protein